MARPSGRPVRDEVLAATKDLIQRVGISGFSYTHLAEEVGVKAPSIHHHFKRKEDLVAEVANQYRSDFASELQEIDAETATGRLGQYAKLFAEKRTWNHTEPRPH